MSVPATEAATSPEVSGMFGPSPSGGSGSAGAADKEMFLKLLVDQMRYQDPMNPTDSSQFLAQSAQFTSLEKMQAVADQTAALFSAQMAFGASGLIGRTIAWSDGETTKTGTVHGVSFGASGPVLDVGDDSGHSDQVSIASVVSVTSNTSPDTTTGSNSGTPAPSTTA